MTRAMAALLRNIVVHNPGVGTTIYAPGADFTAAQELAREGVVDIEKVRAGTHASRTVLRLWPRGSAPDGADLFTNTYR